MSLTIEPVQSSRDRTEFIRLPYRLHRGQPAWVPPLVSEVKTCLDIRKNPFFEHASIRMFLARRGGRTAGRIAAIIDRNFIEVRNEPVGLFGFFEAVDDTEVAAALFDRAGEWLKGNGMNRMLGPSNPSMNDELGVLIDAFDTPPAVKMVWNPPYYPALYEKAGFVKAIDLWAWTMSSGDISERLQRLGELTLKRRGVKLRHPDMKNLDREIVIFRDIYNQAWSQNWGFVPWTEAEFQHVAKGLKQVIDADIVFIAELNGRPVGFSMALPDLNVALRHINGRLFPFGLFVLLWHARKIHQIRVLTLGVIQEYRNRGIDAALYYETFRRGTAKGYQRAEMSWVLENNAPMNRALEMMGAHRYKTYRLYQREL